MKTNVYKTKDLWEAAALLVHHIKLFDVQKKGSICIFIFDDSENKACKLARDYYFDNLQVNAFAYQEAVSKLKKQIFL